MRTDCFSPNSFSCLRLIFQAKVSRTVNKSFTVPAEAKSMTLFIQQTDGNDCLFYNLFLI